MGGAASCPRGLRPHSGAQEGLPALPREPQRLLFSQTLRPAGCLTFVGGGLARAKLPRPNRVPHLEQLPETDLPLHCLPRPPLGLERLLSRPALPSQASCPGRWPLPGQAGSPRPDQSAPRFLSACSGEAAQASPSPWLLSKEAAAWAAGLLSWALPTHTALEKDGKLEGGNRPGLVFGKRLNPRLPFSSQ